MDQLFSFVEGSLGSSLGEATMEETHNDKLAGFVAGLDSTFF